MDSHGDEWSDDESGGDEDESHGWSPGATRATAGRGGGRVLPRRSERLSRPARRTINTDENILGARRSRRLLQKRCVGALRTATKSGDDEDEQRPPAKRRRRDGDEDEADELPPPPIDAKTFDQLVELSRLSRLHAYRDCAPLGRIYKTLKALQDMVGMHDIKQQLVKMIKLKCQGDSLGQNEIDHVAIAGPPGCGKTAVAEHIARIYSQMGDLNNDRIVRGNKANMVSKWLGDTAPAVEKLIDQAAGGTLILDEAYELGKRNASSDNADVATNDCMNTLNRRLTEACTDPSKRFLCIVIGYERELEENFFSFNKGLRRRFVWYFRIGKYSPRDMRDITDRLMRKRKLVCGEDAMPPDWFADKMKDFPYWGGSCQVLIDKIVMVHGERVFGLARADKGAFTREDVEGGFAVYKQYSGKDAGGDGHLPWGVKFPSMYM
jgi:SpoVK/Ycf46/Vps4 family AAA+-type ATPase